MNKGLWAFASYCPLRIHLSRGRESAWHVTCVSPVSSHLAFFRNPGDHASPLAKGQVAPPRTGKGSIRQGFFRVIGKRI